MVEKINKTKKLVSEINRIHLQFSDDYFKSGKIKKVNLSHTIDKVPRDYIYKYRLFLHESINDYLIMSDLSDVNYYYRVKTRESIDYKITRFLNSTERFPVNNWLNDIFGARIILDKQTIEAILALLDTWRKDYFLKNWYMRDKDGYKGIHIYFKNQSNFFFPWELQIWDEADIEKNIQSHKDYKREFC